MNLTNITSPAPTAEELASAPVVHLWELRPMEGEYHGRYQLFGFMVGHPHFEDMAFANSSPVVQIDPASSPMWAQCDSRLYCLGQSKAAYFKRMEDKSFRDWLYE